MAIAGHLGGNPMSQRMRQSVQSISGAQQNLCAENCVFAVIKPIFLISLHT